MLKQFGNGHLSMVLQHASARSSEMCLFNDRGIIARAVRPFALLPSEPSPFFLIIGMKRLVTEFGKLRPPASAALDGTISKDFPNHKDLLAVVDLVPDALKQLPEVRGVAIAPVHQFRNVFETEVSPYQFLMIQNSEPAAPFDYMAFETEVDLLDTLLLSTFPECGFRSSCSAAE